MRSACKIFSNFELAESNYEKYSNFELAESNYEKYSNFELAESNYEKYLLVKFALMVPLRGSVERLAKK